MKYGAKWLMLTVAILGMAIMAAGDTLVTKDGRSFTGRLIRRSEKEVVFETHRYGAKAQITFDAKEVLSITEGNIDTASRPTSRPARKPIPVTTNPSKKGPTYYLVPLRGNVGREITAGIIGKALKDAKRKNVDVVILEIDSPGGHVQEAESIIRLLGKPRQIRIIACVRRGISAAAPIAMACKEIYMFPSATIGGALSYKVGLKGTPKEVEEKFQSVWRASCRKAAELGGHSPLLAEGMTNPDIELSLIKQNGKPVIVEGKGGKRIKIRGQILTLTSQEAVACGLAAKVVKGYPTLGKVLKLQGWREAGGFGERMMRVHIAQIHRTERELAKQAEIEKLRIWWWAEYEAIAPELAKVKEVMRLVRAEGRAAERTKRILKKQYDSERAIIGRAYVNEMKTAYIDAAAATQVKAIRNARIAELNSRFQPQVAAIKDRIHRLEEHYRELKKKRSELIATLRRPW